MSEYQYYEFLAIDRPLTTGEMAELRVLSTRATITPVSFTNEYHWGDFGGNPNKMMQRYFDAHVYVANWMTAVFMVRLPIEALTQETAKAVAVRHLLDIEPTRTHWIITWSLEESKNYDRFGMEDGRGWMARLAPVRDELLRGDLLDVKALDLTPLGLSERGMWKPREEYRGEEYPVEDWARPIIAKGPRPMFEMEQVLPGEDPDDHFDDPIIRSNDLNDAGERVKARKILMELCQMDLRCLDAHSHLGNFLFDHWPQKAIRHYEVGLRIGELSLGDDFTGVLAWGFIDNRPFLRCMHGYGLCLWCLGRFDEAEQIFERMLWLNPSDNQGVRFLIDEVKAKKPLHRDELEKLQLATRGRFCHNSGLRGGQRWMGKVPDCCKEKKHGVKKDQG